jgi:hypothetical protein
VFKKPLFGWWIHSYKYGEISHGYVKFSTWLRADWIEAANVCRFAMVSECTHAVCGGCARCEIEHGVRWQAACSRHYAADGNAHWQTGSFALAMAGRDSSRAGSGSGADLSERGRHAYAPLVVLMSAGPFDPAACELGALSIILSL